MMPLISMTRINPFMLAIVIAFMSSISHSARADLDLMWPEFQLPPLEWSEEIRPGISESELKRILSNVGVQFTKGPQGLSYSSMVSTDQRDYLFCQDRLYAMVEGVFTTGEEFNKWFQTFLAAHQRYGQPNKYDAMEGWSRFRAEWNLDGGSTLFFQLQSDLKDKQGWSRQLYANELGAPCLEKK